MKRIKGTKGKLVYAMFPSELYAQLRTACEIQKHSEGQLVRILVEWSLPLYFKVRSVEGIYQFFAESSARRQHKKLDAIVEGVVE